MFSADDVRAAVLPRPPLGKRGYHEGQVDAFLDQVIARLEGRQELTAAEVRNVRFARPPFGRRGYSEDEVDRLLARVARALDTPGQ